MYDGIRNSCNQETTGLTHSTHYKICNFQLGEIVQCIDGTEDIYGITLSREQAICWSKQSTLEIKNIDNINWKVIKVYGATYSTKEIWENIRNFQSLLKSSNPPQYHPKKLNSRQWANRMVVNYPTKNSASIKPKAPCFRSGPIVKHCNENQEIYGIILSQNGVVYWSESSTLEIEDINERHWELVNVYGKTHSLEKIKDNIRSFQKLLKSSNPPKYHSNNLNSRQWVNQMVINYPTEGSSAITLKSSRFQPGQIVKHGYGVAAHYGVFIGEDVVIGWTTDSSLEPKSIEDFPWEAVEVHGECYSFDQIKANIRDFRDSLEEPNAPQYHLTEFNCEHWATLMVTGQSYSTQSGAVKIGTAEIVGGAMVIGGASAGTVVTIASTVGAAASTGTAISALSGAAASNAAMAWLGGGAVAAGGGGIAAGSAILSAVSTGGAILAVAGVGVITKKVWDNLDESQRQEIIDTLDQAAGTTLSVTGQVLSATVKTTAAVTYTALSATAVAADITLNVGYKVAKKLARGLGLW